MSVQFGVPIVVRLAIQSLQNRALTAFLAVLAIAVSVMLVLGVDKVRNGARASFANTISGTDIVVGARTGGIQLLLYSVFRIGDATNNVSWRSFEAMKQRPEVAWIVPLSLGDSHRGFRVLGTTTDYFKHYKFRRDQPLTFRTGKPFSDLFDAVIGADVAAELGYKIGDGIVVAHGTGAIETNTHADKPFVVAGVLAKTGTPVDRTVHVSLEAIEAIHIDWSNGQRRQGRRYSADDVRKLTLKPKAITAAMVGLTSRVQAFRFQQFVNTYRLEPLSAILPGATLYELWGLVGTAETALVIVSIMVVVTALIGLVAMILAALNERRRELAILRSVGAGPGTIVGLLVAEAGVLSLAGALLGVVALYAVMAVAQPVVDRLFGLYLEFDWLSASDVGVVLGIAIAGCLVGLLPAWRAYRLSVADGMTVKS